MTKEIPAIIKWRDSSIYTEQVGRDEPFKVSIMVSVGLLIEYDDKYVLAGDLVGEGDDCDLRRVIVIPKENVIKVKRLI